MTQWMSPPGNRLKEWRTFRQKLKSNNLKTSLQELVDWFKTAPLSSRVINIYDSETWPGPWDLLYAGDMDENAIALAMAYSLQLCDIDCDLILAQDREEHFLGLVVLVDNEYVLGYTYGTVEDRQCLDTCSVVESYKTKDLL